MNVNVPTVNMGNVMDIGGGPIKPQNRDHVTTPIVLQNHPSNSFVIPSWDEIRTPADLRTLYMDAAVEEVLRFTNQYVVGQFTAANFNVYPFTGTGTSEFNRADLAKMWGTLTGAGVPTYNRNNLNFITHPIGYANMFADTQFYQAYIVGETEAERVQQQALVAPQLNATMLFDQQFLQVGTTVPGIFLHRYAVAGVTVTPAAHDTGGYVKETFLAPFGGAPGFRLQLQMWYDPANQGDMIHIHGMLGTKVVRPEMAIFGYSL